MSREISLEQIRIASPCPVEWDTMTGDDRVRFCGECRLNVYNIAAMTRPEALALVREAEGRVCVQLYRRPDGTVLTSDCPVGLRAAARRQLARLVAKIAAVVMITGSAFGAYRMSREGGNSYGVASMEPFTSIQRWLEPGNAARGVMIAPPSTWPNTGSNGQVPDG